MLSGMPASQCRVKIQVAYFDGREPLNTLLRAESLIGRCIAINCVEWDQGLKGLSGFGELGSEVLAVLTVSTDSEMTRHTPHLRGQLVNSSASLLTKVPRMRPSTKECQLCIPKLRETYTRML